MTSLFDRRRRAEHIQQRRIGRQHHGQLPLVLRRPERQRRLVLVAEHQRRQIAARVKPTAIRQVVDRLSRRAVRGKARLGRIAAAHQAEPSVHLSPEPHVVQTEHADPRQAARQLQQSRPHDHLRLLQLAAAGDRRAGGVAELGAPDCLVLPAVGVEPLPRREAVLQQHALFRRVPPLADRPRIRVQDQELIRLASAAAVDARHQFQVAADAHLRVGIGPLDAAVRRDQRVGEVLDRPVRRRAEPAFRLVPELKMLDEVIAQAGHRLERPLERLEVHRQVVVRARRRGVGLVRDVVHVAQRHDPVGRVPVHLPGNGVGIDLRDVAAAVERTAPRPGQSHHLTQLRRATAGGEGTAAK